MDKHYGHFDGKTLKAGSLSALVKSEPKKAPRPKAKPQKVSGRNGRYIKKNFITGFPV